MTPLLPILISTIRERGPLTFAEFMELALYHPEHGYYATAARRSGRGGDFYTSADVGPLFGELLAVQLDEMWQIVRDAGARRFDLVEAGAGNGRLARDLLDAAAARHPALYAHVRLRLLERSGAARGQQPTVLGPHAHLLDTSQDDRGPFTGVLLANELLDALPVHVVTMTAGGLREVRVAEREGAIVETIGLPDAAVLDYLSRMNATLDSGARAEAGLEAERWVRAAARALALGFLLLVDYGHEASELFSPTHARGTVMAYRAHAASDTGLYARPGEQDLTAHVNLTAVRRAAESAGLHTVGIVDQTYFLLNLGIADRLEAGAGRAALTRRLAARTLLMPGGLGSTMKVMVFARGPRGVTLRGLSSGRLT